MRRVTATLLSVTAMLVAGCKSTGVDQASSIGTRLREAANELGEANSAIDDAVAALKMDANGDLKAQYKNLTEKLDALESKAADIHDIRTNLRSKEDEYVAAWQERQATITDPDLRKKSEDRKNELTKRFAGISGKADTTRANYDTMIKQMRDVQRYLEHDLNAAGISATADTAKSATKLSSDVKSGVYDIQTELKKIADDIDVPPPPPPTPPAAK